MKVKAFLKSRYGGMYVDVVIGLAVIIAVAVMLITLYPVFSTSQHLDESARAIARVAEISGRVGPEIDELLENGAIIKPDTVEWTTTYHSVSDKTIQYKTPFEVTITKSVPLIVIQPIFAKEPLVYEITMKRSVVGVSEVYWK